MYNLLIVEDEVKTRKGLMTMIDWKSNNINVYAQAANGKDAYLRLKEKQPDVILTDIRMPKMSGLDFIQKAKEEGYKFEAIVLTGYKDFNYAKHSINLNVFDYILKPAQPEEILETVLKAIKKIKQRKITHNQLSRLEYYNEREKELAKKEKIVNWLSHPAKDSQAVKNREKIVKSMQMNIDPNNIHVGIIQFSYKNNKYYHNEYNLLKFALENITSETLSPFYYNKLEILYERNQLIWLGNDKSVGCPNKLNKYLNKLIKNINIYLGISVHIGVGNNKKTINDVHKSYREARKALEENYYHRNQSSFFYSALQNSEEKQILSDKILSDLEDKFVCNMFNKQFDQALDNIENWLKHLEKSNFYMKDQINLKAITLIVEMQKFVYGNKFTLIEWENDLINWIEKVPSMKTFEDMSSIIKKIYKNVVKILTSERPIHRTVKNAQEVIKKRYNEQLTLEIVANEVYVSSAYLSSLFKQELGINFLDYLHQYRISQAKFLLSKDYLIYEVANKVGYKDERHFSNTFKKWTGITPTQFQKRAHSISI